MIRALIVLIALAGAGCDDDDYVPPEDLKAPHDLAVQLDLLGPANRGPAQFPLGSGAGGLWWDVPSQLLYLATGDNQIASVGDDGVVHVVATIPAGLAPSPASLGQLIRLGDGTVVVTSNGFGQTGSMFVVHPDGSVDQITSLEPQRRRIGLTLGPDSQLYDTWYVQNGNGTIGAAGVSRVDPVAGETDVVSNNLGRPIGVVATNDRLYVTDQLFGKIWLTPLAMPGSLTAFASPDQVGLLALGPSGTLFAAGPAQLYQISVTGQVSDFQKDDQKVDCVAYDPDHRRVFFVEEQTGADASASPTLHIAPVN